MKHKMNGSESGLSLFELMLASVAIIVILLSVISTLLSVRNLQRLDSEINRAFTAAHNNLAELKVIPAADLLAMDGVGFDAEGLEPVPNDTDDLPGEIVVTSNDGLYHVSTTVTWTGVRGRQEFILETYIAESIK